MAPWQELPARLQRREIDLLVADLHEIEDDPSYTIQALGEHHTLPMCRAGHPLLEHPEPSLEMLLKYPLAGPNLPEDIREQLLSAYLEPYRTPGVSSGSWPSPAIARPLSNSSYRAVRRWQYCLGLWWKTNCGAATYRLYAALTLACAGVSGLLICAADAYHLLRNALSRCFWPTIPPCASAKMLGWPVREGHGKAVNLQQIVVRRRWLTRRRPILQFFPPKRRKASGLKSWRRASWPKLASLGVSLLRPLTR